MEHDTLKRLEDLLRRGVIALERLAAKHGDARPERCDDEPTSTPEAPHLPPILGLTPIQRTVVETARAMAVAESKADLVDWAEAPPPAAATAQPRPAGVFLRPTRSVEPLSWDEPLDLEPIRAKLRSRLFSLLRDKLGLSGEGAKLEARRRCGVESVSKATAEDLQRGIASLATLPDYVAPPLPAGPVAAYSAAAGVARGCSPELAAKLATLLPEDKAPALAELTKVHSQPVLAAAKKAAGIPAGSRAKDVGEARAVVMALPLVERPTPSRAEVLARKLGGSPHAAAVGAELAAAEAGRSKGSAASGLCVSVCDLLKARLGLDAWDALSRAHASLWEGDHPTLGGVLALVDAAPDEGGEPLVPQKGA